jgi:hypothetical protein
MSSHYGLTIQTLPENIKKIYVKPFINNTNQFGFETKFMNSVINEIISDGRLSLVNNEVEADGVLIVTIKRYILQSLTYDSNMVPEYKLLVVIASIALTYKDNSIIWIEPNMEGVQIYLDSKKMQNNNTMSEEYAGEIVCDKMSRNIIRRIVKCFGSIASISDKNVLVK